MKEKEKNRNAITYFESDEDEKVYVDSSNIDSINFENVDEFYYLSGGALNHTKLVKIAGASFESRDQISDVKI